MKKREKIVDIKRLYNSLEIVRMRLLSLKKFVLPVVIAFCGIGVVAYLNNAKESVVTFEEDFAFKGNPSIAAVAPTKRSVIAVPSSMVKAHPFLPYRDIDGITSKSDIPDFELVPPPEFVNTDSTAARVMDTIVSGILYDKYSPSAILNIEGNDYLVKKGDVVNGYNVLSIVQDSVTVKLGENVYKAGIGEILTEGEMNYNEVSNLSNKFGGVRDEL